MRKRLLSILLALCCAVALLPTAALAAGEQEPPATAVWRTIIAPQYDNALGFYNGLGCVWKDGKCGFVDKTGEVIAPQYRYFFTQFEENGLAAVCNMDGKWGFIDAAGNTVIPFDYDTVDEFHNGLAIVGEKRPDVVGNRAGSNYRWGFINEENDLTWFDVDNPEEVDHFYDFQDGYASMMTYWKPDHPRKAYLFDSEGKQLPISYETTDINTGETRTITPDVIIPVGHGLFYMELFDMWDSERYYHPATGTLFHIQHQDSEICFTLDEENLEEFGLIGVTLVDADYIASSEPYDPSGERLGFIDASGQWVIPPTNEHSWAFFILAVTEDDIFIARADKDGEGSKWGVMNKANEVVLPVRYEGVGAPAHGLLPIKENGRWGFMNAAGEMVIPAQYVGVTSFNEGGIAAVSADGQTASFIDTTGAEIPCALDGASVPAKQFFGILSINDDVIASDPPSDVIIIEKDGKYGYAMLEGTEEKPDTDTPVTPPSVPTTPGGQQPPAGADKEPDKEKQPAPVEETFTDVNRGDWYREAVQYVYEKGLMTGISGEIFASGANLSRAMLVTMLYRLEGEPAVSGDGAYRDVPDSAWYADAVAWATQNGIAGGYGGGSFGPGDPITCEQFVVMLMRYAQSKQVSTDLSGYADCGEISPWALEAVQWANSTGLMTGRSGTVLAPGGTVTRAEAATLIMRFCEGIS